MLIRARSQDITYLDFTQPDNPHFTVNTYPNAYSALDYYFFSTVVVSRIPTNNTPLVTLN